MTTKVDRLISDWLRGLGALTAGSISTEEAAAKVGAYAGHLVDFDPRIWTGHAMKEIAKGCQYGFPPFGLLVKLLQEYWREHAPAPLALPGPSSMSTMATADRQWLAYWEKRNNEYFAAIRPGDATTSREHVLGLIRQMSPKAHAYITNATAEPGPTEEQREAVAAMLAQHRAEMAMRDTTQKSRPFPMLPPAAKPFGQLRPEVLEAVRAADPLVTAARAAQPKGLFDD